MQLQPQQEEDRPSIQEEGHPACTSSAGACMNVQPRPGASGNAHPDAPPFGITYKCHAASNSPTLQAARSPGNAPATSPKPKPHASTPTDIKDYGTVFTNAKAGMEGVDKEYVKRVVWEASQGSAHFKNEQRKQIQTDEKIRKLKEQANSLSAAELTVNTHNMDKKLVSLEAGRDLTRTWLHVDMDAFYAACEEQVNPELKKLPMAVGGMSMICTANYNARKFGVRAAMPGFIAKKLCPQLVFVPLNFERYTSASTLSRDVFARYDPDYKAASLDEAYLDVTDYCLTHSMTGDEVATALRHDVKAATGGLTCSCGVGPNKMLAKVCSDINKPDGQYVLGKTQTEVMTFVATLPVRKVPGVGRVTEQTLAALGVTQCRHLFENRGMLAALFLPTSLDFFMAAALGLGATRHSPRLGPNDVGRKGISCERTFKPISLWCELEEQANYLIRSLVNDMDREEIQGNHITLKIKATDFKVTSVSRTLPTHTHTAEQLLPYVLQLLKAQLPCELRLMGLRMVGLRKRPDKTGGRPPAVGTLEWFLKGNARENHTHNGGKSSADTRLAHSHDRDHTPNADGSLASAALPQGTQQTHSSSTTAATATYCQEGAISPVQNSTNHLAPFRSQVPSLGNPLSSCHFSQLQNSHQQHGNQHAEDVMQMDREDGGVDGGDDAWGGFITPPGSPVVDWGWHLATATDKHQPQQQSHQSEQRPQLQIMPGTDQAQNDSPVHTGKRRRDDTQLTTCRSSPAPTPTIQPTARTAVHVATSSASCWTCGVCTYSNNLSTVLRCDVCDMWKGSTPADLSHQQGQQSHATTGLKGFVKGIGAGVKQAKAGKASEGNKGAVRGKGRHGAKQLLVHTQAVRIGSAEGVVSWPMGVGVGRATTNTTRCCPACGQEVAAADWQEHQDMHVAMSLSMRDAQP